MTDEQIIMLVFLIIAGLGLIFTFVGIFIILWQRRKVKLCQEMTHGIVVDYCYRGNGVIVPVVEYHVLGETYKKVRTFRGYITKSWRRDGKPYVRVTKNDCLYIAGGRMGKSDAQNMWPLGSNMAVYYHPMKPKMAFIEKIPEHQSIMAMIFIGVGIFLIIIMMLIVYFIL